MRLLPIAAGLAALLFAAPAAARPPARRGVPASLRPRVGAPPVDQAALLAFLDRAATFQDQQQCAVPADACFGAVHEIEGQPPFSELDTVEALLVWAVHRERVGRADHAPAVDRAWQYLAAHPVDRIGPPPYYQVYACALTLYALLEEERATGQRMHDSALTGCRGVLESMAPALAFRPGELVEPAATALAGAALYDLGEAHAEDSAKTLGAMLGGRAKAWLDADPRGLASATQFATSGGTVYVGVVRSYLRAHPEEAAWAEQVGAQLGGFDDVPDVSIPASSEDWRNASSAWNMLAQLEASRRTTGAAAEVHKRQFRCILSRLVAQDTDGDGGIPGSFARPAGEDQGWISAYAVWMGVGPALADPTLLSGEACPPSMPDGGVAGSAGGGGRGSGGAGGGAGSAGSSGASGGAAGRGAPDGGQGGEGGDTGASGASGAPAGHAGTAAPPRRETGCNAGIQPSHCGRLVWLALFILAVRRRHD